MLVRVLRRRWWLIGAVIVLSAGVAFVYSTRQSNRYQSTASVYVRPALIGKDDKVSDVMGQLSYGSPMETFASIVSARSSLTRAVAELGLDGSATPFYDVVATHEPNSTVLQISVVGNDRDAPPRVAQRLVHDLELTVQRRFAIYAVSGLEVAAPAVKVRPPTSRNVAFATAAGALFGFLLAAASLYVGRGRRRSRARRPSGTTT